MVNIAKSHLILHFSINSMLPLVILAFPQLILVGYININIIYLYFSISCYISYSRFYLINLGLFLC